MIKEAGYGIRDTVTNMGMLHGMALIRDPLSWNLIRDKDLAGNTGLDARLG